MLRLTYVLKTAMYCDVFFFFLFMSLYLCVNIIVICVNVFMWGRLSLWCICFSSILHLFRSIISSVCCAAVHFVFGTYFKFVWSISTQEKNLQRHACVPILSRKDIWYCNDSVTSWRNPFAVAMRPTRDITSAQLFPQVYLNSKYSSNYTQFEVSFLSFFRFLSFSISINYWNALINISIKKQIMNI